MAADAKHNKLYSALRAYHSLRRGKRELKGTKGALPQRPRGALPKVPKYRVWAEYFRLPPFTIHALSVWAHGNLQMYKLRVSQPA